MDLIRTLPDKGNLEMNNRSWSNSGAALPLVTILCLLWITFGCHQNEGGSASADHTKAIKEKEGLGHKTSTGPPAVTFGDKFYDVAVQDQNVWVVGYFGAVTHSKDGGMTWERQNPGTRASLLGVSFVNDRVGWIVGDQCTILHTQDGGMRWEAEKSPVTCEKLLKVQFLNEKVGFAVGSFGVILHTDDGGAHWHRLPFEEDVILNDLVFLNIQEGWIAGEFETILHTVDGGKTWQKQRGDQEGNLFGLAFRNSKEGVAVGTAGKVLRTIDGGQTWNEVKGATSDTLLKVQFYGNDQAVAVGLRGSAMKSSDGGQSWSSVIIPNHYTWLSGLAFNHQGVGFLVGDHGTIFTNRESDKTWIQVGLKPPGR
jgi:photosystem II stability/assembly factor-like uncharacterized protein